MNRARSPEETRQEWARYLFACVLVGSALAIGSLHTQVLFVVAMASSIACCLAWWAVPRAPMRTAARVLIVVCVGLTAYTAFQLVPLPPSILGAISPEARDTWARSLSPLGEEGPQWAPISLDPIATRVQVLRGLTYLAALLTGLRIAHTREGVVFLERALVLAGFSMAVAAAVHPAIGAERVFGAYKPGETYAYDTQHISPLLNTNHLAAFVDIALMISVASAFRSRGAIPRPIAIALAIVFVGTNLWAGSRGGLGALVLGALAVVVMTQIARKSDRGSLLGRAAVALMVVAGGAMAVIAAIQRHAGDYTGKGFSKLTLFKNVATKLLPQYWITGLGRGAFESVFPAVREGSDYYVFTHPENFVLQFATEWGVPITVVALVAMGWALSPRTALARSQPPVGAWAALLAAAFHNLFDFNFETPGIAISLVTCAAIVTAGAAVERETKEPLLSRFSRTLPFAIAPLAAVVGIFALISAENELYRERKTFEHLASANDTTKDAFHTEVREAMLRHPADPYFPFAGELRATLGRDESVLPWAERALERSPVYGRVHLLLGRAFYSRSPAQARLEYKLAYAQDAQLETPVAHEAVGLVHGYDDAMEIVPDGLPGVPMLEALSAGLRDTLPATSERLDEEIVRRDPNAPGPVERAARAALSDVRNHESWCDSRKSCIDEGLALARRVRESRPMECTGYVLVADFDLEAEDTKAATDEMQMGADRAADRSECSRRQVDIAVRTGQSARVERAVDRLTKVSCASHDECVDNLVYAGNVETARGNRGRALLYFKKAREAAPDRDDVVESFAQVAAQIGMHGEALDAYTSLVKRHPEDARWPAAAATERTAMEQNAAQLEHEAPPAESAH